jgi:hypothetical protein
MEHSANDLLLNGKSQSKIDIEIDAEKTRNGEDYASKYNDKKVNIVEIFLHVFFKRFFKCLIFKTTKIK